MADDTLVTSKETVETETSARLENLLSNQVHDLDFSLRDSKPKFPKRKRSVISHPSDQDDDSVPNKSLEELAEIALDCYNEAARISRGKEYNFVRGVCCNDFIYDRGEWFHLNFVAKPDAGTEEFTFFAEIRRNNAGVCVMKCQIVGPTSLVTPILDGCRACQRHPYCNVMVHPITGVHAGHVYRCH